MDLNQLYSDHQISVMRAASSIDDATRYAHEEDAFGTFQLIVRQTERLGGRVSLNWLAGVPNLVAQKPAVPLAP